MSFFGLFGGGNNAPIEEYLNEGAVVIDVRTEGEYAEGHIKGSKNIVLNSIPSRINDIKAMNKKVIAVCRSGARSGQATSYMSQQGIDVINGGPWNNVANYIK